MTTTQAARELGVSRVTVYRWAVAGTIPSTSTPWGHLIAAADVERMKEARANRGVANR